MARVVAQIAFVATCSLASANNDLVLVTFESDQSAADMLEGGVFNSGNNKNITCPNADKPAPPKSGDLDVWRYPFGLNSTFLRDSPIDGLPDYFGPLTGGSPGEKNVVTFDMLTCPDFMKCTCDQDDKHGKREGCFNDVTRDYCRVDKHWIGQQAERKAWVPNAWNKTQQPPDQWVTRRYMLERALGWVSQHVPYHGHGVASFHNAGIEFCSQTDDDLCPQYGYTESCTAMVHMPQRHMDASTVQAIKIHCNDAQPGDHIANHAGKGGVHHWTMFRQWVDTSKKNMSGGDEFYLYQVSNQQTNKDKHSYGPGSHPECEFGAKVHKNCFSCARYGHICNDTLAGDYGKYIPCPESATHLFPKAKVIDVFV